MAEHPEKLNLFEKLNNWNYRSWALKMKMLLINKDLWDVMEDDPENEWEAEEETPERKERQKKLLKVLANIVLMVDQDQLVHVDKAKDGKEAWDNLKNYHQNHTVRHRIHLMKKLFKMELKSSGSMQTHLQEMFEIINELNEMDVKFDEMTCVSAIFASVEREYGNVVTALEAWDENRLTLSAVKTHLIEEWKKKSETSSSGAVKNFKSNFECHFCHEPGHIRRNCIKFKKYVENKAVSSKIESEKDSRFNKWYVKSFNCEKHLWLIDSGATSHVANDESLFSDIRKERIGTITVANGEKIDCLGTGTVTIEVYVEGRIMEVMLDNVLFVPQADSNLVSVSRLIEKGFAVIFDSSGCFLDKDDNRLLIAEKSENLYKLNIMNEKVYLNRSENKRLCIHEWHLRLAHRNLNDIMEMKKRGLKIKDCNCEIICESCIKGKLSRTPFPATAVPTDNVLDCIVSDICGPMPINSYGGAKYFATFIDVHSKYSAVYFLKTKDEVEDRLIEYLEYLKNIFERKVKVFRSDRGTEYMSNRVQDYLKSEGIKFQCTVAYSPQQNGIAERKNRTLVEACRAMLAESKLPKGFWAEAILNANYTFNRVLAKNMSQTPVEIFFGKKQKFSGFHEFGCSVYGMIPQQKRNKLDDKAQKYAFVGYDESSKGYRLADVNSRKVIISRDVVFLNEKYMDTYRSGIEVDDSLVWISLEDDINSEHRWQSELDELDSDVPMKNEGGTETEIVNEPEHENYNLNSDENQIKEEEISNDNDSQIQEERSDDENFESCEEEEVNNEEQTVDETVLRRSSRENKGVNSKYDDYIVYTANQHIYEPKSYADALKSSDSSKWKEAMNEEMESILNNMTWDLVDLPSGKQAIGCKWVYKLKLDDKGNVCRYKARLVAKGYSQKYGENYDEVFAPVARSTTFRILLSIAGIKGYHVKHFDVKTAFLNGEIEEEIYMNQPPGFKVGNKVCKLKKGLYGLKQAARAWNKLFHDTLVEFGFQTNEVDKCLYTLCIDGSVCYLIVHVDDILIASNDSLLIDKIQDFIGNKFEIKNLGNVSHFLGIDVKKDKENNFVISQSQYIDKIIAEAGLIDAKISKFPLMTGYYRHMDEDKLNSNDEYRKLIGMLLYVSTNSRPDIAAPVAILSQKVSCPSKTDLNEVKRIIRYLKHTKDLKLKLSSRNCLDLHIFSDASWAEDSIDRKSNSGYYCMLYGGAISWCSRKQDIVSLSSTESEYVALAESCKELTWIRMICKQFEIEVPNTIEVFTDSQSCIKMIKNQKFSNRTKHIDTKYHYVRHLADRNEIELKYCPTEVNIADMMTKPLGSIKIEQLRSLGGLHAE